MSMIITPSTQLQNHRKQLPNVVILRSFAILTVVLYHCYCPWLKAWDWYACSTRPIYSFIFECMLVGRMPLFVSLSGYLFAHLFLDKGKYATYWDLVKNKTKRLLLPCLLFMVLMCLCLWSNFWEAVVGYDFHLWFLKMLFISFLFGWPILKYTHNKKLDVLFFILAVTMMFTPPIHYFAIEQFQKYFVFFFLGMMMYKYRKNLPILQSKKGLVLFSIIYVLLLVVVLYRYMNADSMGDIIHTDKTVVLSRSFLRIVTILFAFALVNVYLKKYPEFYSPALFKLNKLSFGIYLFHILYLKIIYKYFFNYTVDFANRYAIVAPILLFAIIFTLSILSATLVIRTKWGTFLIG